MRFKRTDLDNLISDQVTQANINALMDEGGFVLHPLDERLGPDIVTDGLTLRKAIYTACGGEQQGETWITNHAIPDPAPEPYTGPVEP